MAVALGEHGIGVSIACTTWKPGCCNSAPNVMAQATRCSRRLPSCSNPGGHPMHR